ncbi:uncharacterized protein LDX57_005151 [Aspergillus melleus]|uniref:uncharacterized protein n=1 Tax=Aspergillus melleus TaxID=138277 RepID=UPI001E8D74AB|nr:uncharacterized protein LDX57_005151 [Aspergillus melleus]KAH8427437.1 hypothetical protein LDX57_005151 [Aspergillus melleus]
MFHNWTSIVGLILLLLVFVDAGHPLWEASTKIKRAVPFDLNSLTTTTWPGGAVMYCWESEATRNALVGHFRHATNLWAAAGLPETRFRFVEFPLEECMRDRRNSLVIHRTPGSLEFSTTVGKYVGPVSELIPGPLAFFNDKREPVDRGRGSNTIAEKIVHEIGHIFGLFHEHQNPYFWYDPSDFRIYCENIEGFQQATAHLTHEQIWGENGVCVNQLAALEQGWPTVAHFLPIRELTYLPHGPDNDVDWDSIMLYHSNVGAIVSDGNDYTLRKGPGAPGIAYRIRVKRSPSQRDVQALIRLYDASDERTLPRLYHDPRSEYHTAFQNLQNFQVCDWPQGGPSGG